MTAAEMIAHCQDQIELLGPTAAAGFVLPRAWKAQRRMRLAGKGSPYGEPAGHVKGGVYVIFEAREVLAWLEQ